jgi:hypothetical protein
MVNFLLISISGLSETIVRRSNYGESSLNLQDLQASLHPLSLHLFPFDFPLIAFPFFIMVLKQHE